MMKIYALVFLFFSQFIYSQQRNCGMKQKMEQMMSDPLLKEKFRVRQENFLIELKKLKEQGLDSEFAKMKLSPLVIPVAIHFPSVSNSTSEQTKQLYRTFALSQIEVINEDYNAQNKDVAKWDGAKKFYQGVQLGNLVVKFEVATKNHPKGSNLSDNQLAVTFGTDFLNDADEDETWAGYMNFVVRDLGSKLLGYSPLGGSPQSGHTVVMNTWCYGKGAGVAGTDYVPRAPFDLGRTVTHELGHFFNLDHTFAEDDGCGVDDDGVLDTPKCAYAEYNCPADGSVDGCVNGEKQLTMNYMDYVDDACMFMFTKGQSERALAYLNTIKNEFKTDVLPSDQDDVVASISVYPNPNEGSFKINFPNKEAKFSVRVVDNIGRLVHEQNIEKRTGVEEEINLDVNALGLYVISINSDSGSKTQKIIVK